MSYPFSENVDQVFTDIGINSLNPGVEYGGTETGALYYEDREINGVMYRVQNATWNKFAQVWTLVDPTKPGYGQAFLTNGTVEFIRQTAGVTPFSTWTVVYSIDSNGNATFTTTTVALSATTSFSGLGIFNVKNYGAKGDGVTDDTVAIQNAANAASAANGTLYFPGGGSVYMISSPITFTNTIEVKGDGMYTTTIRVMVSGYPNFNNLSVFQGSGGGAAANTYVHDLKIDGQSSSAPSQYHTFNNKFVSGIAMGTSWQVSRVWLFDINAFGITIEGADEVWIYECRFSSVTQAWNDGITGGFGSKAIHVSRCWWDSSYNSATTALDQTDSFSLYIEDCINQSNAPIIIEGIQYGHVMNCVFSGGNNCYLWLQSDYLYNHATVTQTSAFNVIGNTFNAGGYIMVRLGTNAGTPNNNLAYAIGIIGNIIDSPQGPGIQWCADQTTSSNGGHIISDNRIYNANAGNTATWHNDYGTVDTSGININACGEGRLSVINNHVIDNRGAPQQVHALQYGRNDQDVVGGPNVLIANNTLVGSSGSLVAVTRQTGSMATIRNNIGYNPIGINSPGYTGASNVAITYPPAIPASNAGLLNPYGVDTTVYVTGGTVSHIFINAVDTGVTSGPITLGATQTIKMTYSVAPTWVWALQ